MRLLLCSLRLGPRPEVLCDLMSGSASRRVAVVVNACDDEPPHRRSASLEKELAVLRAVGLDPHSLDLRDHFEEPVTHELLAGFGAVYLTGGSVFILNRALRRSGADRILRDLLDEEQIVWAGYSAGACVLSGDLEVYVEPDDHPDLVPEGYESSPRTTAGLSVLPFWIVPHFDDNPSAPAAVMSSRLAGRGLPWLPLRDDEALVHEAGTYTLLSEAARTDAHDLGQPGSSALG